MTILAAIKEHGGAIHYGADSQLTMGSTAIIGLTSKWRRIGEFLVGAAGEARTEQLFQHERYRFEELTTIWDFANLLRDLINEDEWKSDVEDGCMTYPVALLVIHHGQIWFVGADLTPLKIPPGIFICAGSGSPYAYGAAHALEKASPARRLKAALLAAVAYDTSCGGPIEVGVVDA